MYTGACMYRYVFVVVCSSYICVQEWARKYICTNCNDSEHRPNYGTLNRRTRHRPPDGSRPVRKGSHTQKMTKHRSLRTNPEETQNR